MSLNKLASDICLSAPIAAPWSGTFFNGLFTKGSLISGRTTDGRLFIINPDKILLVLINIDLTVLPEEHRLLIKTAYRSALTGSLDASKSLPKSTLNLLLQQAAFGKVIFN
jgi:hypothetical protein